MDNDIVEILSDMEEEPDWLIPGIITQGSMIILCGESGAGKSSVSYTLAMAVAAGCKALSGIIPAGEPRRVLYFDDENSKQDRYKYLRRCYKGLAAANGKEPDIGLLMKNFWNVGFALGTANWEETAREFIEEIRPHFIAIDTATPAFDIEDENNNAEGSKAVKAMRRLMAITDPVASSLVMKHAKTRTEKGQVRTVRGAKVWKDQSDGLLFQVKANVGRPRRDNLSLTRLIPDKVRAYGLQRPVYITPEWTDDQRTGLILHGSYKPDKEHEKAEKDE